MNAVATDGAGALLQKLIDCQTPDARQSSIVYSYMNPEIGTAGAHIFGNLTGNNRGQMTFDIRCIHVPSYPDMRKRGIGRMLYHTMENCVKARAKISRSKALIMRVESLHGAFFEGGKEFWKKMGYKVVASSVVSTAMEKTINF